MCCVRTPAKKAGAWARFENKVSVCVKSVADCAYIRPPMENDILNKRLHVQFSK